MRTLTRAAARPLLALSTVLCVLAGAGAAPAAAETLTQKPLPAGCIGEAPCMVGVETFMAQSVAVSPDGRHAYVVAVDERRADDLRSPRGRNAAPEARHFGLLLVARGRPAAGLLRAGDRDPGSLLGGGEPGRPQRLRGVAAELRRRRL